MDLKTFEEELKKSTLDPRKAIEVAGEIAVNILGSLHEHLDDLRVEVAKTKLKFKDDFPQISMAEAEMRVEATDLFREYLRAKHLVERAEEIIRIAKVHAKLAGQI